MAKIFKCILSILVLSSLSVPLTAEKASAQKVVKGYIVGDPVSFDPAKAQHTADLCILQNVFQRLVTQDISAKPPFPIIPVLAERYEISKDAKTITFTLHKGVQFHRGYGELTSEDVVFSLQRHMDPKTGSIVKSQIADVDRIEAPDKYTVRIHLKNSSAYTLLGSLTWHSLGDVISKKAAGELGDKIRNTPIGTGPFYFDQSIPGEKMILKRFDKYWRSHAKIDQIELWVIPEEIVALGALEKGELDIVQINQMGSYERVQGMKGIYITQANASSWLYVLFLNHSVKPMDDVRVRRALAHALDIKGLATRIGPLVEAFPSPIPKPVFGATEEFWTYDYDIEKAKKLLAEAGYPKGFELQLIYKKGSLYEPIALEVQNNWRKVVDVKLDLIEGGVFVKKMNEYKHHVCLWATDRSLPNLYAQFYKTGSPQNYSRYSNPEVDEVIKKGENAVTSDEAKTYWGDFQRLVTRDVVNIWPATGVSRIAIRNNVKNVGIFPFTGIFDFENATVD